MGRVLLPVIITNKAHAVELACDPGQLEYYRRAAALYRHLGGEVAEILPGMVAEQCLIIDTSDVLAGFHVGRDGRANPTDTTMAFVGGARTRGARVVEGAHMSGVTADRPRVGGGGGGAGATIPLVTGVTLASGETIKANALANCAGMWVRQLGERCGARQRKRQ